MKHAGLILLLIFYLLLLLSGIILPLVISTDQLPLWLIILILAALFGSVSFGLQYIYDRNFLVKRKKRK